MLPSMSASNTDNSNQSATVDSNAAQKSGGIRQLITTNFASGKSSASSQASASETAGGIPSYVWYLGLAGAGVIAFAFLRRKRHG